jgi:hypothetical protein
MKELSPFRTAEKKRLDFEAQVYEIYINEMFVLVEL